MGNSGRLQRGGETGLYVKASQSICRRCRFAAANLVQVVISGWAFPDCRKLGSSLTEITESLFRRGKNRSQYGNPASVAANWAVSISMGRFRHRLFQPQAISGSFPFEKGIQDRSLVHFQGTSREAKIRRDFVAGRSPALAGSLEYHQPQRKAWETSARGSLVRAEGCNEAQASCSGEGRNPASEVPRHCCRDWPGAHRRRRENKGKQPARGRSAKRHGVMMVRKALSRQGTCAVRVAGRTLEPIGSPDILA